MTAALAFEGLILAGVPSDDSTGFDNSGTTVRVGTEDLLAAVTEATLDLRRPIMAAVTIGTDAPITGELHVTRGCDIVCCDPSDDCYEFEPEAFEVGGTDVYAALARHHDETVQINVNLVGAVPVPEKIVAVEWAHHIEYADVKFRPLDVIELPKSEAQRLTRAGLITRESAASAGLAVPA